MESTVIDYKKNSLNTIRLIAALQVLFGHTVFHLEIPTSSIVNQISFFFQGVPIFFTMSGFLIWDSIGRSNNFGEYSQKRFWRIYPELWFSVLIEIIVLLFFLMRGGHFINWPQLGLFTLTQSTVLQFWTPEFLRVYGVGCPNGALWTIGVLIQFYFIAFFIHKALHNRAIIVWIISFIIAFIISWIPSLHEDSIPEMCVKLYSQTVFPYLWMFILAMFVAEYKNVLLVYLKKYWYIPIAINILFQIVGFDVIAGYGLIKTLTLFAGLLGFAYAMPALNIKTDISYGIYIYHMTIINAIIELGLVGMVSGVWLLLTTLATTSLLAWASTKTVGEWSLSRKQQV
jgi:peptidoglycan/LPS O-acetylase OafA/YrhL